MIRLEEKYKKEVVPAMMEKFGYRNPLGVPKIKKIVVNTSFGRLLKSEKGKETQKTQETILKDLSLICGQKPVLTSARKSIAGFKLKKGEAIGAKVTLRKKRMWDFLERVINIALPRTRDFQGISEKSIDENGNLTIGFKEHIVFPEVAPEKASLIFGLEATIVTTAKTKEEAKALFKLLGFPLKIKSNKK